MTPLSGLRGLTRLNIREKSVGDIGALSGFARVTDLHLSYNSVADLSVLRGLTALTTLRLYNNPITDIGPLRGLTGLTELHVHDLPGLSDIGPLLDNTGLGSGDRVYLYGSNVGCEDAAALQAKGVSVGSSCFFEALLRWSWVTLAAVGAVVAGVVVARRRLSGEG